jgi:hypothetical protein
MFCVSLGMLLISYFEISSAATIVLAAAALFIAVELTLLARAAKSRRDLQALKTE